jgi:hypothetical protein
MPMATVCIINGYSGTFDRGARVTSTPRKHVEIDEKLIQVGKPLPKWACIDKNCGLTAG